MEAKRICVVSGRYPQSGFESYINHKFYCDHHGYTYIYSPWSGSQKNRYLNKLEYLKFYLPHFDYLFWIDDDAFFINMDQRLEDFLPKSESIVSICKSPDYKSLKTFFSSGQFFIKNSHLSHQLLDRALQIDLSMVKDWWTPQYGYFTGGDQDILVYLSQSDPNYAGKFDLWDYYHFNSRFENLMGVGNPNIFVLHFTGKPRIKLRNLSKASKLLGRSKYLLLPEQQANLNLQDNGIIRSGVRKLRQVFA